MNYQIETIQDAIKANAADAKVWLERMETFDSPDWSEMNYYELTMHIMQFHDDWESIYSKVA